MTPAHTELERLARHAASNPQHSFIYDTTYLSAANPVAILSLLADIRRLEEELAKYKESNRLAQNSRSPYQFIEEE